MSRQIIGKFKTILLLIACLWSVNAFAARAKVEWKAFQQPDGTVLTLTLCGDERFNYYLSTDGQTYTRDSLGAFHVLTNEQLQQEVSAKSRRAIRQLPPITTDWDPNRIYRQLVILLSFEDYDFSMEDPLDYYNLMFNEKGHNKGSGAGCVADYFRDQSNGRFNLQFDVYGPYKVSGNAKSGSSSNYGGSSFREATQLMVAENPDIDYSLYDWDNDRYVDQVIYVYAGLAGNVAGNEGYIWPNTSSFSSVKTADNHTISAYTASAEKFTDKIYAGFGTVCHEFTHSLGLPDIYPTSRSIGVFSVVDEWDLMDGGNFTGRGWCPPNYSPLEKMLLGWLEPEELTEECTISGLKPVADGGKVYQIKHTDSEYYLLENRQWSGWDFGLPGQGLVVYHVSYSASKWGGNTVNNTKGKPNYCLVTADNLDYDAWDTIMTKRGGSAYAGKAMMNSFYLSSAPYPWRTDSTDYVNNSLTATSVPATVMYNKNAAGKTMLSKSITDITQHADGTVSFTFHPTNFVKGDANDDLVVNAADIVEVVNYIMGNPSAAFNFSAADVNGDGSVNAADIVLIVNMILSSSR